ncbi:MAG: nuclear transport factor 2 family protein [Planococcus donghaensis]
MKKMIIMAGLILTLAACSNSEEPSVNENTVEDGNATSENNAVNHGIEEKEEKTEEKTEDIGFTVDEQGNIIAADVPKEPASQLLAAYKEYIAAFNSEDIDRYMGTIAQDPDGFDREEDKAALVQAFEAYDSVYETSDETIVKYEENRAEVFASLNVKMKAANSNDAVEQTARQVVIFKKENGEWKVSGVHLVGNQ